MADHLTAIAQRVVSGLRVLGYRPPTRAVVRAILETVYLASLRTEETRFVRGSVTFADPQSPDVNPPLTLRAHYPHFTRFTDRHPLTVELIGKLSRAVDQWSGSVAIYGAKPSNIVAWGVIDQLVHSNVILHREPGSGMSNPGMFAAAVDLRARSVRSAMLPTSVSAAPPERELMRRGLALVTGRYSGIAALIDELSA